jgi:hypothetical protein
MRAYMTDAPLPLNPRNKIIPASKKACACPAPRNVITHDSNMARKTHIATYFGSDSEYSFIREVDDLKIFDNANESQPPKLVCVYPGKAFVAEYDSNELNVYWISADPVGTSTIGDTKKTEMNAKRYQSELILKARRVFGSQR